MIVTCDKCKKIVDVNMYFFDTRIVKEYVPFTFNEEYYKAFCSAKTICPICGSDIFKIYASPIDEKDIIKLATGKERE